MATKRPWRIIEGDSIRHLRMQSTLLLLLDDALAAFVIAATWRIILLPWHNEFYRLISFSTLESMSISPGIDLLIPPVVLTVLFFSRLHADEKLKTMPFNLYMLTG